MKMSLIVCLVAWGVGSSLMAQVRSQADESPAVTLRVGDPAPPLRVERFVKGEPIDEFKRGQAYVVEFWATWCGPCIQQMAHLSKLQAEYEEEGVTIIGTNIREMRQVDGGWEESFGPETLAKVEAFVASQGDRMGYVVAFDGAAKSMDKAWMGASRSEGLPTAFLVDRDGTIAWIGHPMVLRMPLREVVHGTWDVTVGPERVKEAEAAYLDAMRMFSTDVAAGLTAWERAELEYPLLAKDLVEPKFQALLAADACAAAYVAGRVLAGEASDAADAYALNRLAWSIVDPRATRSSRDLDLALLAATQADELTGSKDPSMLDTLARVYFSRGEVEKAVDTQRHAVSLAEEPLKSRLADVVEEYERARK